MDTYIIRERDEETFCTYCGQPLEIDDRIVENAAADPFCSKTCAVIHDARVTIPY